MTWLKSLSSSSILSILTRFCYPRSWRASWEVASAGKLSQKLFNVFVVGFFGGACVFLHVAAFAVRLDMWLGDHGPSVLEVFCGSTAALWRATSDQRNRGVKMADFESQGFSESSKLIKTCMIFMSFMSDLVKRLQISIVGKMPENESQVTPQVALLHVFD